MHTRTISLALLLAALAGSGCLRERPLTLSPAPANAALGSDGRAPTGQPPNGAEVVATPNPNGGQAAANGPPGAAGAVVAPPPERSWFSSFCDRMRAAHAKDDARNASADDDRPHEIYAD
jgi:hypothetical protein